MLECVEYANSPKFVGELCAPLVTSSLSESALELLFCVLFLEDGWVGASRHLLSGKEQGPVWHAGLKKQQKARKKAPVLRLREAATVASG